jgi:serine/threonine-protein kinase HipA
MKIIVTMDWEFGSGKVGELDVHSTRGAESYQFTYTKEWAKTGFQIDPTLELVAGYTKYSQELPGVFQDISPDRWGRMVMKRANSGFYGESDFMLGVSDSMRMGALRLSDATSPDVFVADNTNVPKLVNIRALEEASRRLERGLETESDLLQLLGPGTSLGGAHPKAVVQEGNTLYLAKFQSRMDTERVCAWEATMLDLADKAGIPTPVHRLLNKGDSRPILLLKRFDRNESARIPFVSAMTLTGRRDGEESRGASYAELASVVAKMSAQSKSDCFDLWRRMTFNAMTGNTDDHLRNHAFLRDQQGWRLSPAYDLNPNTEPFERRTHALAFLPGEYQPSLKLCIDMAKYINLDKTQVEHALKSIGNALEQWKSIAQQNGLHEREIKRYASAFEHEDSKRLISLNTRPIIQKRPISSSMPGEVDFVLPNIDRGRYTGQIVGVDERYVYQSHGKETVRHELERFSVTPKVGGSVQIAYQNGFVTAVDLVKRDSQEKSR